MLAFVFQVFVMSISLLHASGHHDHAHKDDLGFSSAEIVPDIIDVAPKSLINVNYGDISVKTGSILTPTQAQNIPSISYASDPAKLYTLAFLDPDAPNRTEPAHRSFKHWLVVNIPGDNVPEGDALAAYLGAGPGQGSGLHRYVFLVFGQPKKLHLPERVSNTSILARPKFSIRDFASKHGLGNPVAGNYFQAEYDNYVEQLHAQLTGR